MAIRSPQDELEHDIAAMRRFNRFYTQKIGVLREGLLDSPFTLTEARVLYELAHRERPTATEIGRDLGLDTGYLSRILAGFKRRRLVSRTPASDDRRRYVLSLTEAGRKAFAPLDEASREEIAGLIAPLPRGARSELVRAMSKIEAALVPMAAPTEPSWILRGPKPGDLGWIVHRQGRLYAEEHGWDASFEALVAEIAAAFFKSFDPKRERCWIAERSGDVVGSIFLVRESDAVAKLRLLYVEPSARGLGIGRKLVQACIAQARAFGYRKLTLWTNDVLGSARRIYEAEDFRLAKEEHHHSFGKDLVGQYWELIL